MALINKLANFLLNVNDVIVENIDFGLRNCSKTSFNY